MLSREVAQKVLGRCLITGGDFAEIFEEDSLNNSISILNGKVENSIGGRSYGIGIRIFKGLKSVYAYTNNNSLTSLLNVAQKAALALGDLKEEKMIVLNEKGGVKNIDEIEELLPVCEGFFFGDYSYSSWYVDDIKDTIEQLTKVLQTTDFEKEKILYTCWW